MSTVTADPRTLAKGVLYCLLGKAIPDFPGSTRANPSRLVWVGLAAGEPLSRSDTPLFPMVVRGDIWQQVIVPVLKDYEIPGKRDPYILLVQLEQVISEKLKEQGFLPPNEETSTPDSSQSIGELIVRDPPRGDPRYPIVDVDSIYQPDGNLRLVYPEVDGGPKES